MRANEFLSEQQLNELDLKKSAAIGTIALSALGGFNSNIKPSQHHSPELKTISTPLEKSIDPEAKRLASRILSKYKIDPKLALTIAELAKKHEDPVFPKAKDILSIIGIESSFNSNAISKLKKDPAMGLTQIRPKIWGLNPTEFSKDIEKQISKSAEILSSYNKKLKNPTDAVHAYNIGITSFLKGKENYKYVDKFEKERELYR